MNDRSSLVKLTSFAMFLSCAASAFCLGMLAFTLTTGDLPFGLVPMMRPGRGNPEAERILKKRRDAERDRTGESFAMRLYDELEKQREELALEREQLAEDRRMAETVKTSLDEMMVQFRKALDEVKDLMDEVDAEEKANVKRIVQMLEGADVLASCAVGAGCTSSSGCNGQGCDLLPQLRVS